jgi:hypothetical protein
MTQVVRSNLQIYELVVKMQATIPPQMERQQPVYFLDACGRLAPFHLEFITSAEAFLAVLKVKFKDCGLRKIENGEFFLEETHTLREIDIRRPWEMCFRPGQTVAMSICFERSSRKGNACPACQKSVSIKANTAIVWYSRTHKPQVVMLKAYGF